MGTGTAPSTVLAVEDVDVHYGAEASAFCAVKDLSLDVGSGEFVSIIGPSGCGKSTVLGVAAGLRAPTSGVVRFRAEPVTGPRPDDIAMVFQDHGLFPWLTVRRNIETALKFQGVPRGRRSERADEQLRRVGLLDFAESFPGQLSGGMRQRVGVARALSLDTPLILMDEPFGALDEQTRIVLGEDLSRMLADESKSILLVTHSLAEAAFLSDRVVVMTGRPGTVGKVLDVDEEHPRTSRFMTSPMFHTVRDELFELLHDEMRSSALMRDRVEGEPDR